MTLTEQHSLSEIINPFEFIGHSIRTAVDSCGEVWFCAKDVYESLGITWKNRAGTLKNTPENWICTLYLQGQSGRGEVIFISEPAVYQALFRSNQPNALQFANWVFEEVLPSIRKQGFFGTISSRDRLQYSKQILTISEKLTRTRDAMFQGILIDELRDLCNLVGRPMSDMNQLGKDAKQMPLELPHA